MNSNELIARLVEADGGLCVIDQIFVPYQGHSRGPAAKIALGAELYFGDVDRGQLRRQLFDVFMDFWNRFPQSVNQYLRRDARQSKKFKGDPRELIEADMAKHPIATGYSANLSGMVDIGIPDDEVDPYQCSMLISREEEQDCSFLTASMPVCDTAGQPRFDLLRGVFIDWCRRTQPAHGSAGLTFVVCPGMEQNSELCLPVMKRFPGIDFPEAVGFSIETAGQHNRLKGVNWLTALSAPLVMALGGRQHLLQVLPASCVVHDYDGGLVIQAGAAPQLGDTLTGDIPQDYRAVARATHPVRFEDYNEGLFRVSRQLDEKQETLAWIRRFD